MIFKKFLTSWIRKSAQAKGMIDPFDLIAKLTKFAKPSDVAFPTELLRMGSVLQARGLLNAQAIQHNLDWVWPYWVEKQFDPRGDSFLPRAFNLSHINLTHRNWTAIGQPDLDEMPIVDPRGLVTPFYDSWSLDAWIVDQQGNKLIPSKEKNVSQTTDVQDQFSVQTKFQSDLFELKMSAKVIYVDDNPVCHLTYEAVPKKDGARLFISLRPYNPEGVSLVEKIEQAEDQSSWIINQKYHVLFNEKPDIQKFSNYENGDVYQYLFNDSEENVQECRTGMATAAAGYELSKNNSRTVEVQVPLNPTSDQSGVFSSTSFEDKWDESSKIKTHVSIEDQKLNHLNENALKSLLLLTTTDCYPGPFTYKHFWYRDAVLMGNALLNFGHFDRCEKLLDLFFERQRLDGFFCSQDGEWDSNGQVLWFCHQYQLLSGESISSDYHEKIKKGAEWIIRKRVHAENEIHNGLMPSGFSAEHFGPNDYYYWDDFWSVAGLRAAAEILKDDHDFAQKCLQEADELLQCIQVSLQPYFLKSKTYEMPSSPYRRMDSASVGSIVAGYPLQVLASDNTQLNETVHYLVDNCLIKNGFYHEMSHSGINPYLTLHIAQNLLRNKDVRYKDLMNRVQELASPTGQWPEAIHPQTDGGCMGDGHHGWASAEWLMMVRNCLIREEDQTLFIGSGVDFTWFENGQIELKHMPTRFGIVDITFFDEKSHISVFCSGNWFEQAPEIKICLPDFEEQILLPPQEKIELSK